MKKIGIIIVIMTVLCWIAYCGDYVTRAMGTGGIAVTNDQKNASWDLSAVTIKFGDTLPVSTETVRVSRVSCGIEVILGASQTMGESMFLALPEGMAFKLGDIVKVYGGGATGMVQVFTK